MASRRQGRGGNAARNPRNNITSQRLYLEKFGRDTKSCTGLLHYDGPEVSIYEFRQANGNKSTFLQSRCDLCNRLYFSIQQKPIKRLAAALIYSEESGGFDWRSEAPQSLLAGLNASVAFHKTFPCPATNCLYSNCYGDFRSTAAHLTKQFSGADRQPRDSSIVDENTGRQHPAPLILHDLQSWVGKGGALWGELDTREIWNWWKGRFHLDTAFCSQEQNEASTNQEFELTPHPISDFDWGSGNIKDTVEGHTLPAFNQVRRSASLIPSSSAIGNRVYGFLCDGNHLEMLRFSVACKKQGLSLGHSPAPLRWLGKNDPINGRAEPLIENVQKGDSLAELYEIALVDPERAAEFVSWQLSGFLIEISSKKFSLAQFTQEVENFVEAYFDGLATEVAAGDFVRLEDHIRKADPGKTDSVYQYRGAKLRTWLLGRPSYINQHRTS